MKYVLVEQFGDVDELKIIEQPTPDPGPGQVRVKLTSIGMNHAELMARRGEYKIASGDPPFTPGLEGGGVIDAVGEGVTSRAEGDRVILSADAPREAAGGMGGTYRTHYVLPAESTVPANVSCPPLTSETVRVEPAASPVRNSAGLIVRSPEAAMSSARS